MSEMSIPRPVIGGSYVYCPFRQWEIIPDDSRLTVCRWRKRLRRARAFKAYRHHWVRRHQ